MLNKEKHINYIRNLMGKKNIEYYITEQSRIFTLYWMCNSLKILGSSLFYEIKDEIIDFVKKCLNKDGGFGGNKGLSSTVISTFHSLQLLFIYDIPFYNQITVDFLLNNQTNDGSFINDIYGEKDTRFDCCAILSIHLLSIMKKKIEFYSSYSKETYFYHIPNFSFDIKELSIEIDSEYLKEIGFNKKKFIHHILDCYNLDGGFSQIKGSESHTAQIFCCLSVLRSLGALYKINSDSIEEYLVYRQCYSGGINGRLEKLEDVCYSFWGFASLLLIKSNNFNTEKLREFIFSCEGEQGGFSDRKGDVPDPYHQMFSLASLSLLGNEGLNKIDPGFCL